MTSLELAQITGLRGELSAEIRATSVMKPEPHEPGCILVVRWNVALTLIVRLHTLLSVPDDMYPDPHIPSAPTERSIVGDRRQSSSSNRIIRFVIVCIALATVVSVTLSVMRYDSDPLELPESEDGMIVSEHSDEVWEPRYSTRSHPTRLP